jgi:hypothetical protein
VTATATGNDGWANSAPSNVNSTGTDTAPVENYGISPTYSSGATVETAYGYSDADGDPLESCTATCTDDLGLACCTIINCRTDFYGGAPGHVRYSGAGHGADGKGCSMHLHACNHWACFNDNAGFN